MTRDLASVQMAQARMSHRHSILGCLSSKEIDPRQTFEIPSKTGFLRPWPRPPRHLDLFYSEYGIQGSGNSCTARGMANRADGPLSIEGTQRLKPGATKAAAFCTPWAVFMPTPAKSTSLSTQAIGTWTVADCHVSNDVTSSGCSPTPQLCLHSAVSCFGFEASSYKAATLVSTPLNRPAQ